MHFVRSNAQPCASDLAGNQVAQLVAHIRYVAQPHQDDRPQRDTVSG